MDFKAIECGKDKIDLRHHGRQAKILRPIEIHHKEDGSLTDKPTFCIVMSDLKEELVMGEISLEMMNAALRTIGYKLGKITNEKKCSHYKKFMGETYHGNTTGDITCNECGEILKKGNLINGKIK